MAPHRHLSWPLILSVALGCALGTAVPTGSVPVHAPQTTAEAPVALPNKEGSLKFGILGDFGTGDREQYQLGEQMAKLLDRFRYRLVVTVGDNIYGSERPQDFIKKFELPYKALLAADVKFYASLGHHDDRTQTRYKLFNMDGRPYYTFKAPDEDVRFFALHSDYPQPHRLS